MLAESVVNRTRFAIAVLALLVIGGSLVGLPLRGNRALAAQIVAGKLVVMPAAAALVRRALERLGPAFIKAGQLAATRRDLVAPALVAELEKLQDDVPAVPGPPVALTLDAVIQGFAEDEIPDGLQPRPRPARYDDLVAELEAQGIPAVIVDARRAKQALSCRLNRVAP